MKRAKSKPVNKVRVLDEETSAIVIAEYLAIEDVKTEELDFIEPEAPERGLSYREIALTFRVSETLAIPSCFEMAPKYRLAFARARLVMQALKDTQASAVSDDESSQKASSPRGNR